MRRNILIFGAGFSIVALFQLGCAAGEKSSSASPTPTVVASPTPTPTASEALTAASEDLTHALKELRTRNIRGSLELVDRSIASLNLAAAGAGAASRVKLEEAIKKAEASRELIANGDKKADEALSKVDAAVTDLVKSASTLFEEAKESAKSAIGAAADKVKEAVGATPTPTPKAALKKK
jgi:NADH dehydrogenase/NADH:ubiquinone oxidoreductase subunit G